MAKALPALAAHAHARRVMAESPRLVTRMITCGTPFFFFVFRAVVGEQRVFHYFVAHGVDGLVQVGGV